MQYRQLGAAIAILLIIGAPAPAQVTTANPVLFVSQVPIGTFGTVTAVFGNHIPGVGNAPRGGDLVLRYPDGTLRFLTAEAGYGSSGMQGANAIAVREPCVHWSGQKALFSMIVGAATQRYQVGTYFWQIYEVSGLGAGETAQIRYVTGQPANFNNVSPIYATDGRILFASDRPITGAAHHHPQRDEYESAPIVTGIYSLDETTAEVKLLEHSPSGSTSLSLDSFGRVIFTKWDHLQRDQQGDAPNTAATYKAFTWASEAANATTTTALAGAEVFPEPRATGDPTYTPALAVHRFNHFFPWEINEDGTAEETLNHVGRHELGGSYTDGSFTADNNLSYYVPQSLHANELYLAGSAGLFHLREDPTAPGDFYSTYAQEFGTASGGTLIHLNGAPNVNPEDMVLTAITPMNGNGVQVPQDTGYFRNPLPMSDGMLIASHTMTTGSGYLTNLGNTEAPNWSYAYRLKVLQQNGAHWAPGALLTPGISKSLSWWTPDSLATYNGALWELDAVEVVVRPIPAPRQSILPAIEANVFAQEGVDVATFQAFLESHQLALIIGRNVTQRDRADRHQPFNLQVPGGVQSIAKPGTVYDVSYLQIFQADALRGYNLASPSGRRLLPRPMHQPGVSQSPGAPPGGVALASDGSFAALVPAQRALSWQITDDGGVGIVRERNWLSFQSGEIRVCTSCHGINKLSQTGHGEPQNEPQALHDLLSEWKASNGGGPTATPVATATPSMTPGSTGSCASGITIDKARLRARQAAGTIAARGTMVIPKPWTGIAPATSGVRIVLEGVLDITVPGGAGWTVGSGGKRWRFRDANGTHGGITRLDLADRSSKVDGLLAFQMRIVGPASMPVAGAHVLAVHLGGNNECATAHWNAPAAASPRCRGTAANLTCN